MLKTHIDNSNYSIENGSITIINDNGGKCKLGNISYILNRTNIEELTQYSPEYGSEFIMNYIFKPINIIFNNKIFTEEKSLLYINFMSNLRDLRYKSKKELKEELFDIISQMFSNVDSDLTKNLITVLPEKDIEAISVVYYCSKDPLIKISCINKDDYISLINISLSLKYTLPILSNFPNISNLELYTELYRGIIQEYFHDVYCKINELIKYRIRNNFTRDKQQDIYKYYSTIIEADIFMSIVMYYNVYKINSDNNLLNMISFRIDDILNDIGSKYIINFIEE